MSKKKIEDSVGEFLDWLPSYDWGQRNELVTIVAKMLASLPGGDEFEDLGYEPYSAIGWKEFEMISNIFVATDGKLDVEHAAQLMFADEEGDEDE